MLSIKLDTEFELLQDITYICVSNLIHYGYS